MLVVDFLVVSCMFLHSGRCLLIPMSSRVGFNYVFVDLLVILLQLLEFRCCYYF